MKQNKPLQNKQKKHKIGKHGAVFFVTAQGDICSECGEEVKKTK